MNAPGRTCTNCGGGIASIATQDPPHFCTFCGKRYAQLPDPLPHTTRTQDRLRKGANREAIEVHNAHVASELARAKRGETINLSDLMAAREEIAHEEGA